MTAIIQKALDQIINVTGNLHGGQFRFLSVVCNLFYGSFLQCLQTILGWKRIYGSDIASCYQQAAGLAIMVLDEVERKMIAACLHHVDITPILQTKFYEEKNPKMYLFLLLMDT